MAVSAWFELRVGKILEAGKNSCVLGGDRHGRRQKIVLFAPASVALYSKLVVGCVYRLSPAPSKRGDPSVFSYSSAIPTLTFCDASGFPSYPSPIGVEQIDATLTETYQDIRVTVSQDFGIRDYDTQRGKVVGRELLCEGVGDRKFELMLWGDKAGAVGIKKGVTVVFYDVWIKKSMSHERSADRMELSGSLSVFGYGKVETLLDDVVQAFTEARCPNRKRKLSELAGLAMAPGADEAALRARLTRYAQPGSDWVVESGCGETWEDAEGLGDLLTFLADRYDGKVEEWDPRVQTVLLQGSCDRIQKEVTTALSSLVNIFCRVAIHGTQLKTLRSAQEQLRLAEAAEAKFVAAVTSLRREHAYTWSALMDLGDFLAEKYRTIYVLWVEFAKLKIEGRSGFVPGDKQDVMRAFFDSVKNISG